MPEQVSRGDLELLVLEELEPLGVEAVVTLRAGGVSEVPYDTLNLALHVGDEATSVLENRTRLAAALGCDLDDLVFMDQVHGTRVAVVGDEARGRGARSTEHAVVATDALVTATAGLPLVVMVADCAPVVLLDPDAGILAVVHAGWRGTAAGVVPATVEAMGRLGAQPSRTVAVIGPTIDAERYEVGDEVVAALHAAGLQAGLETTGPRAHVDLARANAEALERTGVPSRAISICEVRTDDVRLFSDRSARPCGRFALVARLADPAKVPEVGS